LAAACLAPSLASAHGRGKRDKGPRPTWGGWGHATLGTVVGSFGDVGSRLDDGDVLGGTIKHRPFGLMFGGGGRALLAGRYLIGGKGFAMVPQAQITSRGRSVMVGGGGGLDIGLVLYNKRNWLVYPLAGFGGFGYTLTIDNQSEADVTVTPNISLSPEESIDLQAGFATFELGVGIARSMFWGDPKSGGAGGMMHGLEVGVMMAVSEDRWKTDEDVSVALPPASLIGGYLRMNIGGGGFFYK
ncbi:MAG: hypothetical protein AAF721_21080, partial [Myxococcota bacterium]